MMKQELNQYRKTIHTRCVLWGLMILIALGQMIYGMFFMDQNMQNTIIFGFQAGFSTGIASVGVIRLIHYRKVLGSDKQLQLAYNEEHDERMQWIRSKAGMPTLLVTSTVMILVGIIAGYFNVTVFFTLVGAGSTQLMVGSFVKMYYVKTM